MENTTTCDRAAADAPHGDLFNLRELRTVALDWYDGRDSAMYAFAYNHTFDMELLAIEAAEAVRENASIAEAVRLRALADYTRVCRRIDSLRDDLRRTLTELAALGLDTEAEIVLARLTEQS